MLSPFGEAVPQATGGPSRYGVGHHRMFRTRPGQSVAIGVIRAALGAGDERRAELRRHSPEIKCGPDPLSIHNPTRGDHRQAGTGNQ